MAGLAVIGSAGYGVWKAIHSDSDHEKSGDERGSKRGDKRDHHGSFISDNEGLKPQGNTPPHDHNKLHHKRGRPPLWVWLLLGMAFIGLMGAAIWCFFCRDGSDPKVSNSDKKSGSKQKDKDPGDGAGTGAVAPNKVPSVKKVSKKVTTATQSATTLSPVNSSTTPTTKSTVKPASVIQRGKA